MHIKVVVYIIEVVIVKQSVLLSDKYCLYWINIEITNDSKGRPKLNFISIDRKVEKELKKIIDMDISISHLKEYAIANVSIII